jgi:hypothetical protein
MIDMEIIQDPVAQRALAERRELFRIAAQSALDRSKGGKTLDPDARSWALRWAAIKPLDGPLSEGLDRIAREAR